MAWKDQMLYSVLRHKCPRCHEGDLFIYKNPYSGWKVFEMPKECPSCGQRFQLEPGFYYGAMYVSYGLGVAWFVAVLVAFSVLYPDFSIHVFIISTVISMLALTPVFFRFARAIWINMFVKYEKGATHLTAAQKSQEKKGTAVE